MSNRATTTATAKRPAFDVDRARVSNTGRTLTSDATGRGWSPDADSASSPPTLHSFGGISTSAPAGMTIGRPDDQYEAAAERAAEAVIAGNGASEAPAIGGGAPRVQARAVAGAAPQVTAELPRQMQAAATEGRALPTSQRTFYEDRLGHDFGAVRIHAGPAAAAAASSVQAQAFAHGSDVYFGENFYQPDSPSGQRLIAHELAHTVQQRPNVIARRALDDAPSSDGPDVAPSRGADEEGSQPPGAIADQLGSTLEDDQSDRSGQVRDRLSRLSPSSRRRATAALQGRQASDPSQDEGRRNVAVTRPAPPAEKPDAGKPSTDAAARREGDRKPEQRPGTPEARAAQSGIASARPPAVASASTAAPDAAPAAPPSSITTSAMPQTEQKPAPSQRAEASGPPDAARMPPHAAPSSLETPAHAGTPGGGGASHAVGPAADDDRPLRLADLFEQPQAKTSNGATSAEGGATGADEKAQTMPLRAAPSLVPDEHPAGEPAQRDVVSEPAQEESAATEGSSVAQMEALASDLETASAAATQALKTQSTTVSAHARQQAATARGGIRAEVNQAIKQIQAGQAGLLSELSTKVTATHALIDTSLAARKSGAIAAGLTSQKNVKDIFSGHRASVDDTVIKKTKAAEALRDKKGEVVRQRNQADIKTAYRMGGAAMRRYPNTMRGAYIGGAAFDVAEATAKKMREQEPDLVSAIKENTEPLAEYFRTQGAKALEGFDVNLPKILASADDGVAKTLADQDKRAREAHTQLDTIASQTRSEISAIGLEAVAQAAAFGPQVESRLDAELGRVLKAISDEPGDVMRRISPPIEEAITLFRSADQPDVDAAKALTGGLKGFVDGSVASAVDTMEHAAAASGERFQGMHGSARQAMAAQVARTNKVWDGTRAGIAKTTGTLHSNFDNAVAGSVSILSETLTGTENTIRTQLAPIVDQIGASFDDTLRDAEGKIDARIDEGMAKNTEALADLGGQMDEAAVQAAFEYDHPVLSSIETGLEFLTGIIAGIIAVLAVVAFFLLVGWIIASVLGVSMLVAGLIILAGTVGFAIGLSLGARLAAGQGFGEALLGAVGDFGRSVPGMLYDMTGIPKLRKAFSDEPMTPYQRGKLIGEGGTELVLAIFMVRGAAKGIAAGFKNLPRFKPPVATPEITAIPEIAAPRGPPAAAAPVEAPVELPGKGVGAIEPRPPTAPPEPVPNAPRRAIGFGDREPIAPKAEPAPGAPRRAIGFGDREPIAPKAEPAPGAPRRAIGFGDREPIAPKAEPAPGAPRRAIGFGDREPIAPQPEPRPPAVEGPGPAPEAPANLRGQVIESGRPSASEPMGRGEPIRAGGRSSVEPRAQFEPGGGPKPVQGTPETPALEEPPAVEQPAEKPALEQPAEQAPPDEPAPKQPETAKPKTTAEQAEPAQKPQPDKPAAEPAELSKGAETEAPAEGEASEKSTPKDPAAEQKYSDLKKEVEGHKSRWEDAAEKKNRLRDEMNEAGNEKAGAEKELGVKKQAGKPKEIKAAQDRLDAAKAREAELRKQFKKATAEERDLGRKYSNKQAELEKLKLQVYPEERSSLPCFAADTAVWSATGPKPICALVPGDMVKALDLASKAVVLRQVDAVYVNRTVHFYDVRLDGEVIRVTARHRFWLPDEGEWIEAKELKVGARLLHWDGLCKDVEDIVYQDVPITPTYNLRVEEHSNYFVGPGVLVHNDGPARYSFGDNVIYEGTNPDFPGKVYVGRSNNREIRQGAHRREALKNLKRTDLTKEEREFWEFKKGMKLKERISGLNDDQAAFMEQKNIDIEVKVNKDNLVNRDLRPVSQKRMARLEKSIANDPAVRDAGFCPK